MHLGGVSPLHLPQEVRPCPSKHGFDAGAPTDYYTEGEADEAMPTPSSDVALCVVVESHSRRPRDRVPDYLPTRFPVGMDLVVLTEQEFQQMEERAPSWYRAIVSGKAV